MTIKHVAVSAAMAIFSGTMISGAGPAQADRIEYGHTCSFSLRAPDGTTDGPIYIFAEFLTSESEASVRATSILIENDADHEIILDVNRWQPEDGTTPDRGPGDDIPGFVGGSGGRSIWYPSSYFRFDKNPSVVVHAYAKSRPGLNGGGICLARPIPG